MKKILYVFFLLSSIVKGQDFNTQKLDTFLSSLEKENKLMGTISIAKDGKEVYFKSFGYANLNNNKKADRNTKFRIGSITKTITATIIMQLVDEGKLTLNTKLSTYFPQLPNASKITIEDLLRHQSGLVNITSQKDIREWITKPQTRNQMLARFVKNGIDFQPKEKLQYSNTNYIILSYIIEDIDKKTYARSVKDRITIPLQLNRTEFGKAINPKNNEAFAYYFENNKWNKVEMQTDMSAPMGAGAIVSTSSDLVKLHNALFNKGLVSKQSLEKMTTVDKGMGLGLSKLGFKGLNVYGHDGGIDGFESFALTVPKKNMSLAITTNGSQAQLFPTLIAILEIYFENDKSLVSGDKITVKTEDLDKYLGVYSGKTFPAKVTVTKKDNTLFAQATGQPLFKLSAVEKDTFRYDAMGITFAFNPEKNTMILNFAGNKHSLSKK